MKELFEEFLEYGLHPSLYPDPLQPRLWTLTIVYPDNLIVQWTSFFLDKIVVDATEYMHKVKAFANAPTCHHS